MASGIEGDPDTDEGRGVGVPHASGELLRGRQDVQPTSDKIDASPDFKVLGYGTFYYNTGTCVCNFYMVKSEMHFLQI